MNEISTAQALIQAFNDKPIVIYPVYLKLTKDYATAAALAQVLYWHKTMKRKFYKTDADFSEELFLTPKQFERVKLKLKTLDFLIITREQIPAKTFYDVDYGRLAELISPTENTPEPPSNVGETRYPQKGETVPPQKGETVPPQKGETNTENTTEITQNNNNTEKNVVDVDGFSKEEQPAARKVLSVIPVKDRAEVIAVLIAMATTSTITNKIGYLKRIVDSVLNETFTPLPKAAKQKTAAERIEQERQRKAEDDARYTVTNADYFAEIEKKYGKRVGA